jgi:PqqD family protein of HPr-rel-A system
LLQGQASTSDPANGINAAAGRLQRWRVAANEPLKWRCWSGDYVVFNPLSGQTHFLEIFAGHVLKLIMSGTSSILELRSEAARFLEVESDDRLAQTVEELLRRLEEVGLIEPAY